MESIAGFSGLASGVQWRDLVDQIAELDARPVKALEGRQAQARARSAAWESFRGRLDALGKAADRLAAGDPFRTFAASVGGLAAGRTAPFTASVSGSAQEGTHSVRVLRTAAAERLGGAVVGSRTDALGIAGEFLVNGRRVEVSAGDSLDAVVRRVNAVNTGADASGVSASVLSLGADRYRLVLASARSGAEGIDLVDGASGALRGLGLLDAAASLKHATSNGARSDAFSLSGTAVATLRGMTAAPAGTVGVGPLSVALDLSTMSLDDVAAAINTAAAAAGSAVTASVAEGDDGWTLSVAGTTAFADAGGVLEALGIVEAGRASVAQTVRGAALEDAAGAAATAATRLVDLGSGGASAGVAAGDTIVLTGTRGDGSTFEVEHTVATTDTLQTILDTLNDAASGFGAGARTATASLTADGRIQVTDGTAGDSRLALSIVARNEGGGTLDFGGFDVAEAGRARVLLAGADAEIEVDGTLVRSASNTVTDALEGVTLSLASADPATTATLTVTRDADAAAGAVKSLASAYNALADFVDDQLRPSGEGAPRKPLAGDSVLRSMRSDLKRELSGLVASGVAGDLTRLGDLGIEITRYGRFEVDDAALKEALAADPGVVERLFGVFGEASSSQVSYLDSSDATGSGVHALTVTQAATTAKATGAGFAGGYVASGPGDRLRVTDVGSGRTYAVALTAGMSAAEIVDALQAELATARAHQVATSAAFLDASTGLAATDATRLADLRDALGADPAVAAGDVITISGRRADGTSFLEELTLGEPAVQTLADVRAAVQSALGSDAVVEWDAGGALRATSRSTGSSLMELSLSYAGAGTLSFGTVDTLVEGRSEARIAARLAGGQIELVHEDYGSAAGFEIAYDGTGTVGLAAGRYTGLDVAGTLGGVAATGAGRRLTGADGSAVEGLVVEYTGTTAGDAGTVTFSRGIADAVRVAAERMLGSGDGSIGSVTERLEARATALQPQIDRLSDRVERRREQLIRRFVAMEQAMAKAQTQSQWLTTQMNSMFAR